jgi:hypothetical protein
MELRQKIVALFRTEYAMFNDTHLARSLLQSKGFASVGRRQGAFAGVWGSLLRGVDVLPGIAPVGLEDLRRG